MNAHPIELSHPSEAIKLTGIGPKLVEKLTERLETYCRSEGLPIPTKPTKSRFKPIAAEMLTFAERARSDAINAVDQDDGQDTQSTKRTRKINKAYVPKYRSGSYALLLTLANLPEGQIVGLTKEELKHQAQPLADASFTVAPDPSKFHTAWNSMGVLESKHLVYSFGRPTKRYALTDEGWILAKNIRGTAMPGASNIMANSNQVDTSAYSNPFAITKPSSTTIINVDSDDGEENQEAKDMFESRIRQKFGSSDEFMTTMAKHLVGIDTTLDQEALDLISEFARRGTENRQAQPSKPVHGQNRTGSDVSRTPNVPSLGTTISQRTIEGTVSDKDRPTAIEITDMAHTNPRTAQSSGMPVYEPIIAPPGSFTVELILDSREVRAKTDRNYLQDQFKQVGLMCEQRALQVGDMVWTARIHDPAVIEQLDIDDRKIPEVILDYVVERKRLDDLDSSIKDGRFLEQKFRLKRSGIKNAIYIIEDYGSLQVMEDQQHTRLTTAMAATQIIDGIFVKRTRKLDDTIAYLASVTRLLKEKYERKSLHIIPSSVLSPQNHFTLRAPKAQTEGHHYVTYEAQASLASKSATLTLRDVFLKTLMCTRGITGDKAIEIQKRWPTPRSFREALETLPNHNDKREMVWKIAGNLPGKRKIGKAVSQTLAEIWGAY